MKPKNCRIEFNIKLANLQYHRNTEDVNRIIKELSRQEFAGSDF